MTPSLDALNRLIISGFEYRGMWAMGWQKSGDWPWKTGKKKAWHGTNMEAIYSAIYYGRLLESNSAERG